jgi:hypothetical protein
MPAAFARYRWCLLLLCALSWSARAQYDLEQPSNLWLRALVDVRLAGGGPAPSWTDGGPGKMRYGGSTGFDRVTRLALSQAALQVGASLPWDMRAQAQVNLEPDIAHGYHPWLIEAIVRKEWGEERHGWGLQSGVMNVPFSLENVGPAWSPEFTISLSALDSWLWEDISLAGVEAEWWRTTHSGLRLDALVGAGYGGDQIGRLLALRGWVLGDTLGGINGQLAIPGRPGRSDIFNERDHKPTLYGWLSVEDAAQIASLKVGVLDNQGDESDRSVWHTHFSTVGLVLHPLTHVELLAQFLDGVARVRTPANDSAMSAFYALLSYHHGQQRLSFRYDSFRVRDLDGGPSTNERGHALTSSYLIQLGLRSRIALEYIWMSVHREVFGSLNPTPDGWQISYRFRY